MKRIVVFCGSSMGSDEVYAEQAMELGEVMAQQNIELVYGGAKIGLMGVVADAVLKNGGKAIGVMPYLLGKKEVVHQDLHELIWVETMHERKAKMNELCDGVIALPGGFGTMDELFEMLTWAQLGIHRKPIGLLNTKGYYDDLIQFIQKATAKSFVKPVDQKRVLISVKTEDLIQQMKAFDPPPTPQWATKDQI